MAENRYTYLAGGLLIGALAGAAAGLLSAPKSGKETRAKLAAKTRDAACRLQEEVGKAREKGKGAYESLLTRLQDLEAKAERKAREIGRSPGAPA